ncbi:MAG: hypothetical protein Q8O55_10375 [Dehalococcoidales bacterium]|nr:hypothetical protein [Dehalococcoidales bacterium]
MNYLTKICPRCKAPLQQKEGAFELTRKGMAGAESSAGIPVSLYSCPQCGYIELYNLRVTASI